MVYPNNFEQKIGFEQIRALLNKNCLSSLGVEFVAKMSFSEDYDIIHLLLSQTDEFIHILQEEDKFPTSDFVDLRSALNHIKVDGTWIDEDNLFDLRRSLFTIHEIVSFLNKEGNEKPKYPSMKLLTEDVSTFPNILKGIDQLLDKYGRIKDNASPSLNKIRREKNKISGSISNTLHSILRAVQKEGLVEKDVNPTIRDGRLVIPVAPAHKRRVKGIVHDESATGKTVFIEPAEVVELNNRIRELENDERREIIKILIEFSNTIRPYIPELSHSYIFLAKVDFIRAKAKLAISIDAIKPSMENKQQIRWYRAFHPLLLMAHRKNNKEVVPLDIELENNNRILIISGPNAGGKSVCLKTVGLLQYMFQCGIPVPVDERSVFGIFSKIFIDIGDEQSIEDDLSTYSSHLSNMKFFVRNCDSDTLLLIDEFGGGTEPQIGGAIAESLLKRFNMSKSFGVITTHYQNLKNFANENKGIVNGAMLYDRHQMQPLFTLSIGNPGSSFAIEIARKIGLPEELIADASKIVGSDYVSMDKYLQDIVRDKRYWENKRQAIRKTERELDKTAASYETNLLEIEKERKEIIRKAKDEAGRLISDANAKIENTIRTIREAQAEREKTLDARKDLREFQENLEKDKQENDKISSKIEKLQLRDKTKNKKRLDSKTKQLPKETKLAEGDSVRLKGQTTVGQILDLQRNKATVAFGMIKTTANLQELEYVNKNEAKRLAKPSGLVVPSSSNSDLRERKQSFKQEIDLRGMRGDEALQATMYFVDDAILVGASKIRILHGTGTGALRQLIREYLGTVASVHSYKDEHVQFGGAGITVIDLE